MKTYRIPLLVVVCISILLVASFSVQNAESQVPPTDNASSWQHLAVSYDAEASFTDAEFSRRIVRLGNEGWELVDVESIIKDGTTTKVFYCFKKRQ